MRSSASLSSNRSTGAALPLPLLPLLLLLASIQPCQAMNFVDQQINRQVVTVHRMQLRRDNASQPVANLTLYFYPETAYNIREGDIFNVSFAYTLTAAAGGGGGRAFNGTFRFDDESVAAVLNPLFLFETNATVDSALKELADASQSNSTTANKAPQNAAPNDTSQIASLLPYSLQLRGVFLGRTELTLAIDIDSPREAGGREFETGLRYRVSVIRRRRLIDDLVQFAIWIFVILANVGMGCELDMRVIKSVLRKPVAPVLGFVSQYIFMPMVSFCMLLLIDVPASTALGYFGMGCAPGGGASNFYCLLLGGDISLSITMTLVSTLAALGVTPLYMLTLGQYILKSRQVDIKIPYANILIGLLIILVPTAIGYLIQTRLPRVAKVYRRVLKPAVLVFVVFMFTVGVYANLFIWRLFNPAIIAAGCALPYAGFLLGGILAAVFRQPWPYVKTISLETGIQNPGVPIVILQTSLPLPDADLSLVGPFAAATFTPMPLFVWVAARYVYYRCYLHQSMFTRPEDVTAEIDTRPSDAAINNDHDEVFDDDLGPNDAAKQQAKKERQKKKKKGGSQPNGGGDANLEEIRAGDPRRRRIDRSGYGESVEEELVELQGRV